MEKAQLTGPEHFRAGEDALSRAKHLDPQGDKEAARLHAAVVAEAQAHFTAAQTLAFAALAAETVSEERLAEIGNGWSVLLGVKAAAE